MNKYFFILLIFTITLIIINIINFITGIKFLKEKQVVKPLPLIQICISTISILIFPFLMKEIILNNFNISNFYFTYMHFNGIFETYYIIVSIIINALVLWFYLWSFNENSKKEELKNKPILTLKFTFDNKGLIYLNLKNSGKTPAYNINVKFDEEIPYPYSSYKTLNKLPLFNNLAFLDAGECISIFYDGARSFFEQYPEKETWEIPTKIDYEIDDIVDGKIIKKSEPTKNVILSFKETSGLCYTSEENLSDLTNEIRSLKHFLMLNLIKENDEEKYNEKNN